jgi:hypothetical protein
MDTNNLFIFSYYQLYFMGMALLFAGIIPALFFLGRSIGLSPTSINTTDHFTVDLIKAFFPGKRKAPLCISISSRSLMMRQHWDSDMP